MVPKVASERRNVRIFFQTAISRELSDRDTKSGSEIENFYENLIFSPQPPGLKMSKICQVQ